jgi:hypothetical protein
MHASGRVLVIGSSLLGKQFDERHIDVVVVQTPLHLVQKPRLGKPVKISGSGLAADLALVDDVFDPGIGVPKDVVQKVLAIDRLVFRPQPDFVVGHQHTHLRD